MPSRDEESGSLFRAEASSQLPRKWQGERPPTVWTIAGFDPSSGAGITADLQTFAAHGLFGCSAITALTVQNTVGVFGWEAVRPELLRDTLARLREDLPPAGVKLGMLGTPELAAEVARVLAQGATAAGERRPVVFDPVLRSSSGRALFPEEAMEALHTALLPQVGWITPNWAELAVLTGQPVEDAPACEAAMRALASRHPQLHVVATGGDQDEPEDRLLLPGGELLRLPGQQVETTSTHGTGCAFSSALLAALVRGAAPVEAVRSAKAFVEGALRHAPGLGQGRGPMGLLWPLQRSAAEAHEGLVP